jgi:hypothetical protein
MLPPQNSLRQCRSRLQISQVRHVLLLILGRYESLVWPVTLRSQSIFVKIGQVDEKLSTVISKACNFTRSWEGK